MEISRREAIHRLSVLVGGTLSAPALNALLAGCRAEPGAGSWTPQVLSRAQADMLGPVVDLIIPATDTPGARDVGVPAFIDKLLADWVDTEDRERFLAGLAEFEHAWQAAPPTDRSGLLTRLDREAAKAREDDVDPLPFFATLKEWTLVGYYTSEAGATQELQWHAAPGTYEADLPLDQAGRTWA